MGGLSNRARYVTGEPAVQAFHQTLLAGYPIHYNPTAETIQGQTSTEDEAALLRDWWRLYRILFVRDTMGLSWLPVFKIYLNFFDQELRFRMLHVFNRINENCRGRRMVRTSRGYCGLVPASVEERDQVVLLKGGTMPFILRRNGEIGGVSGGSATMEWKLIGEAYVHGVMKGELFDPTKCVSFTLL